MKYILEYIAEDKYTRGLYTRNLNDIIKLKIPNINSKLAEELGWHIGDGSMNNYLNHKKLRGIYQLRGHFKDDKEHYIKRIKPFFESLYKIKINLRDMPSTRVFGFQIWNDELVKFKQRLGLPLGKKLDISIPRIFLKDNKCKISIIRGIFDTDGCLYLENKNKHLYPRLEIKTISKSLGKQLLSIIKKLGFRVTLYQQWIAKNTNRNKAYVITVRGVEMLERWFKIIRPANSKHIKKFNFYINNS